MTWKELKQKIEEMPAEIQESRVSFLDEDMTLRNAALQECRENIYFNPEWDTLYFESELVDEDWDDPLTEIALEEGKYYFLLN